MFLKCLHISSLSDPIPPLPSFEFLPLLPIIYSYTLPWIQPSKNLYYHNQSTQASSHFFFLVFCTGRHRSFHLWPIECPRSLQFLGWPCLTFIFLKCNFFTRLSWPHLAWSSPAHISGHSIELVLFPSTVLSTDISLSDVIPLQMNHHYLITVAFQLAYRLS